MLGIATRIAHQRVVASRLSSLVGCRRTHMNAPGQLKQGITKFDVISLGISAAVGVSVFSITAPAAEIAGPAMLIALAIAAVPMGVFVFIYSFMGSAVPRTGSSYDWPAQFVHPYIGFIVSWLRILGNAASLQLMAVVFVSYLLKVVHVPALPVMLLFLFTFYVLNLIGVGAAGRFASVLVILKIVVLGTFILMGAFYVKAANFHPLIPHGPWSILAVLPLLVGLYTGIESAAEAGEEIRDSRKVIGGALAVAAFVGMGIYFGTSIVSIGVLGSSGVAASKAPLLEAGTHFLGSWMSPLVLLTALASIAAAVNATFLIFARFLFAMGRDGTLPAALAKIHPRWGTPFIATTVAFVLGVLALALPERLAALFLAANIPTMLKYLSNCLAAVRLVKHYPELHAQATLRVSRRSIEGWGYFGVVCAVIIALAGLGADWRPYAILAAWGFLGTVYWAVYARHRSISMHARARR